MAIVIVRNDNLIGVWKDALSSQAPDIPVYGYGEPIPESDIKMAAVWKHPPGSLNAYPNLRGIQGLGAGVDFIFDDVEIREDLPIMRVVDPYLASDMAEFVLAVSTGMLKRLQAYKYNESLSLWKPETYQRFKEVTVGIMGLGKLGLAVAQSLESVGFSVVGWTRNSVPEVNFPVFRGSAERNQFLNRSQILVCLLPLTPETRGILNREVFSALPRGARLINVARGPLLEDADLLYALEQGMLSEACLDVFHNEPLPQDHPFWNQPAVHITPHIASVSDPKSVAPQIISNYRKIVRGEVPENRVSRSAGY